MGAAGAATGFARTLPMKGRAIQHSWIARVRRSKSDSGSPKGGIRADSSERSESESKSLICGSRLVFLHVSKLTHLPSELE